MYPQLSPWLVCDHSRYQFDQRLSQSTHIYRFFFALGEACGLLYHRLVNLKQQIFDCRTGFPRPKPIEAMGLFGIIFNFCTDYLEGKTAKNGQIQLILFLFLCVVRMIHAAIMVSDAAPNVAFRSCKSLLLLDTHTYTHAGTDMHSVIFEFPWQFGIAALACYMFGVAHTLSDVSPNCATSICISQQSHHLKCSIFYTL